MKSGEGPACELETVSDLRPLKSQSCDLEGRINETQTHRKNLSKKPIEADLVEAQAIQDSELNKRVGENRLLKTVDPLSQKSFLLPLQGGQTQSRSEVARKKVQQNWEEDLMRLSKGQTETFLEWLTIEKIERATNAELARPGSGLEYILREMSDQLVNV